jgi:antirestriction protein ArdC
MPGKDLRAGANPMMKSKIYAAITEKIIANLEN